MPAKTETAALGVLPKHIGFHLRLAQLTVFKRFESRLGEINVSPAIFSVLEVLHKNEGITQSKLASVIKLERSSVVPLLDKLGRRGLVERKPSATDRRYNELHLTALGQELLIEARRRAEVCDRDVCEVLSVAERAQLLELLQRLWAARDVH